MSEAEIIVYCTEWCGACYLARRILERNNVPFHWIDIDEHSEGENFVLSHNNGMRSVPTILFEDGTILVEPTKRQLLNKLGIVK